MTLPGPNSHYYVGCTPDVIDQVAALVRIGVPPTTAALASGVPVEFHDDWMDKGENPKAGGHWRYVHYRKAVLQAEAEAEVELIRLVKREAKTNYQAAAWLAERRWPDKYVRKSVNASGVKTADPGRPPKTDPFKDLDGKVTPIRKPG